MFSPDPPPSPYNKRLRAAAWLALATLVIFVIDAPRLRWLNWEVTPQHNINLAEALAWHQGTFELQGRHRESAKFAGRPLNAFPPAFTLVSYVVVGVQRLLNGRLDFPPWAFRVLLGPSVLLLSFWAFRVAAKRDVVAALLTVAFLLGTPMLVMISVCRIGGFFEVNHFLACCGLLLITGDVLGRRRVWPSLIGLALAFWSRQLTLLYLPAIVWMIVRSPPVNRRRHILVTAAVFAGIVGTYALLNWLKFGSPFDSGYIYIYEGRDDLIARRARLGLFHTAFFRDNLHYMFFEPPGLSWSSAGVQRAKNDFGASIWLTTPLLFAVVFTLPQWWKDPARRALMLCSFAVMVMLLLYHNTGWRQPGYYRFALDFIPVWLVVIAPWLWGRYRTPLICLAVAWSVWYFRFITWNNLAWAGLPDT